jgi:transaldolase
MKIFLDTAHIEDIQKADKAGCLSGVTTNPSIIARENAPLFDVVKNILAVNDSLNVLVEVTSRNADEMVRQGLELSKVSPHVIIKIPAIESGLAAVKKLSSLGVSTTVTLVFSANQAILASMAGADYIAPFAGRLDDIGSDGLDLVRSIKKIFLMQKITTKIITASVRSPLLVSRFFEAGSDVVTVPYKVFADMIQHPLTESGLLKFEEDWLKVPQGIFSFEK